MWAVILSGRTRNALDRRRDPSSFGAAERLARLGDDKSPSAAPRLSEAEVVGGDGGWASRSESESTERS